MGFSRSFWNFLAGRDKVLPDEEFRGIEAAIEMISGFNIGTAIDFTYTSGYMGSTYGLSPESAVSEMKRGFGSDDECCCVVHQTYSGVRSEKHFIDIKTRRPGLAKGCRIEACVSYVVKH